MDKKIPFSFFNKNLARIPLLTESFLAKCDSEEKIIEAFTILKEGLLLSSPDLYETMLRYESLKQDKKKKALISFYKYLIRASTRATPYGLFSGTFCAEWGSEEISLKIIQDFRINFSLDFRILAQFKLYLDNYVSDGVSYYANNTYEKKSDVIKILKFSENEKGIREYYIVEFTLDEPLQIILSFLKNEKKERVEIIKALLLHGADVSDAEKYVAQLIDAKILISEFEIFLNNNKFFDFICDHLDLFSLHHEKKLLIRLLRQEIYLINNGSKLDTKNIKNASDLIVSLLDGDIASKIFFKSDMVTLKENTRLNISNIYQQQLLSAVDIYNKLGLTIQNNFLNTFSTEFTKQYQYQSIPLLQLLDPDYGLIYGQNLSLNNTPLIDDLPFINYPDTQEYYSTSSLFISKLNTALANNQEEIILKNSDIEEFEANYSNFSDTIHILYRIIDVEKKLIQIDTVGSDALSIIARFSYGCNELSNLQKEIVRYEDNTSEKKGCIRAEIMHIPDRIEACNIIDNSALRSFQIPIAYNDGNGIETILPDDILVTVRNKKFVLYSKCRKKEILPCISSMLLPASVSQLPLFRFLTDVAIDNKKNYSFSWSRVIGADNIKQFPRLRYKNIILSPTLWKINKNDVSGIIEDQLSADSIALFLHKFNIPQKVVIKDYDNELLIDFNHKYAVEIFISEVTKSQSVILAEYLYSDSSFLYNNYNQNINSQLVAFLYKDEELINKEVEKQTPLKIYLEEDLVIKRNLPPGSEWLYYKIYCSENDADKFLTEELHFLVDQLFNDRVITSWFFIKYIDEGFHIRLRFLLIDKNQNSKAMIIINNFITTRTYSLKISIHTYEREIERYGKKIILWAEDLFYYDSQFTISLLAICKGNQDLRWKFAMHAIDDFLNIFDLSIDTKINILFELKEQFNSEFNYNAPMNTVIKDKFRKYRNEKTSLIDKDIQGSFTEILDARRVCLLPISVHIKKNTPELIDLLKSFIHMSNNRYFISDYRKHESVLYNIMYKDYVGQKALIEIKKLK